MADPAIVGIANPFAANRSAGRYARRLERSLRNAGLDYGTRFTKGPLDATRIARELVDGGVEIVVSIGGDGTLNEIVNGAMGASERARNTARLAIAQVGTGTDFSRTVQQTSNPGEIHERLRRGRHKPIDVGLVEYTNLRGEPETRYFVNIAEFGSGGAVVEKVNRTTKVFGGRVSFLLGILTTMPKYRNKHVEWRLEVGDSGAGTVNNFVVANGRYFGGGLLPAPHAELDDGLFDIVVIGDLDWKTIRKHLKDLRRGTHLAIPQVTFRRSSEVFTTSREHALLDLDGELVGRDPTRFVCVPKALNLVV